jgi:glutamyl-Q tRNA(Asp) synthetase
MQPVFRFAPSPNGFLHLGHAYSALLNSAMARAAGGRFLVRIEDIDTVRCTEALVSACLEDLEWLGLAWEQPVLRQSGQFSRYRAVAAELEARGLVYPCFCSRGEMMRAAGAGAARDPDGALVYPGTCRRLHPAQRQTRLAAGEAHAVRLDMGRALETIGHAGLFWMETGDYLPDQSGKIRTEPGQWGDIVLVRKECPTSYHLSVVLDDALQGVTHIVRGGDLYAATGIHRLLQTLLDLPEPAYHHHALLTDDDGRKLAKSATSKPLRALRTEGVRAEEIRRNLGFF